jgi:hypothetical protein
MRIVAEVPARCYFCREPSYFLHTDDINGSKMEELIGNRPICFLPLRYRMKFGIVIAAISLLSFAKAALQSCPDLSDTPDVFDFVVVGSGAGGYPSCQWSCPPQPSEETHSFMPSCPGGGPLASRLAENGFSGTSLVFCLLQRLRFCSLSCGCRERRGYVQYDTSRIFRACYRG